MIDIQTEALVSMTEAAKKHYPGRPHPSTLFRQSQKPNRYGIILETIVCGGKRMTSVEAIERYIIATTEIANGNVVDAVLITSRQRQAEIDNAEAELDAAGI